MAEFLFEIFCEEIPARMQARAGENLQKLLTSGFEKAGLAVKEASHWTGPRRLGFVCDLPERSPDISEERKGPRVGAPEQALAGFMRGAGLSDISQAEIREDKKGAFYIARIEKPGRPASGIIMEIVPEVMNSFPWPKSMKSGSGNFRWVRPLQRLLCLFGGEVIPVSAGGVTASNLTEGHRLMGRGPFKVASHKDYVKTLEGAGHVMLERAARERKIEKDARALCKKAGLELVEDAGLLAELAGLAEWPIALLGEMKPEFLKLPDELTRLSMREHQKYFAVRNPKTGKLAPNFIVIANQAAPDGGKAIAAGNARVLSARLSDAQFFQSEDARAKLIEYYPKLASVIYHKKLGSMKGKAERVAALAKAIAPKIGADAEKAEQAARLAKSDLVTQTVIEFPSLQGTIGRAMYEREMRESGGGDPAIARAIEEHYKPQGPSDDVPKEPISMTVSLADKLDSLAGFWAIDEKPTGSKDPYALRRAALGIVRTVLDNDLRLDLKTWLINKEEEFPRSHSNINNLLAFILDRLKVYLRDQGLRHDVLDAVYALRGDDLVDIVNRARALQAFLETEAGRDLLAGYRRAANILKAEAKKGVMPSGKPDKLSQAEAQDLASALDAAQGEIERALACEDYGAAMTALSELREPIDAFFDKVTVNDPDPEKRENRLRLLHQIYVTAGQIANLDLIEG